MYEFINAMRGAGLKPPDITESGKIYYFAGLNKPKTNKAARCLLFPDRCGGWFMDYSTGLFEVWQAKRESPYNEAERAAFRQQCERDRDWHGNKPLSKPTSKPPPKRGKSGNQPFMPILAMVTCTANKYSHMARKLATAAL